MLGAVDYPQSQGQLGPGVEGGKVEHMSRGEDSKRKGLGISMFAAELGVEYVSNTTVSYRIISLTAARLLGLSCVTVRSSFILTIALSSPCIITALRTPSCSRSMASA